MKTQDTSTEIALLLPTQLSPRALCLSSSLYCYFCHTCPVTARMIGTPTRVEKPDQMDVWWHILLMERLDHPTNQSESSDKTGTVVQCASAHAFATTHQQPDPTNPPERECTSIRQLQAALYYNEPILRPQPHSLKNNNEKPHPLKSDHPKSNSNFNPTPNQTPQNPPVRIHTYGFNLPCLFHIPIPILSKANLRHLHSPPHTLKQLYTSINAETANDF